MNKSYILILYLSQDQEIEVGKLGKINFKKGYYCYVGSAKGKPIDVETRVKRYFELNLTKKGNLKWHIDYLLVNPYVKIVDVIKSNLEECELAKKVESKCIDFVPNFGNSDCNCESHLFFHYVNPKRKILEALNSKFKI